MKRITGFVMVLLLGLGLGFACSDDDDDKKPAVDPVVQPKPDPKPDTSAQEKAFAESLAKWEAKKADTPTYSYEVVFTKVVEGEEELTWKVLVGVEDHQLACRTFKDSKGNTWSEEGDTLNQNEGTFTGVTIDDIYKRCEANIKNDKFKFNYTDDGILLGCNQSCGAACAPNELPIYKLILGEKLCEIVDDEGGGDEG